jgi:hypothetical protein
VTGRLEYTKDAGRSPLGPAVCGGDGYHRMLSEDVIEAGPIIETPGNPVTGRRMAIPAAGCVTIE